MSNDLIKRSIEELAARYNGLTYKQMRAVQLLGHGIPAQIVSSSVGVSLDTINNWLSEDSIFNDAIIYARESAVEQSKKIIEQTRTLALDKALEILSQDYSKAFDQERREIARMARFVLERSDDSGSASGNSFTPQLFISTGSIDAIAARITELDKGEEYIEGEYIETHPSYSCHPETDYGVINYDDESDTRQCHICGGWFVDLFGHTNRKHGLSQEEYRTVFRIDER